MGKLTVAKVRALTTPGRYGDGDGLWLQVRGRRRQSWLFRYMLAGRAREMGLGPADLVTLAEARAAALQARKLLHEGVDPLEQRRAERAGRQATRGPSFREVAELYVAAHEAGWRNAKHRAQWRATLDAYAVPAFGDLPVAAVDTAAVTRALEPIWRDKPETASRLRGRIEAVLDFATARGWRTGENPARWRGHLANLLPARSRIAQVVHHAALPWHEIGAFMAELRDQTSGAAPPLELAILTAARSGEVLGARWGEVDWAAKVWTVPAARMKAGREHRVPLSEAALALLRRLQPERPDPTAFLFPGARPGRPLSNMAMAMLLRRMGRGDLTAHGFRSTFRDWCAEYAHAPREVAEAALAHTLRDKVEAAYQRGDLLARRARLMEEWATFCARPLDGAEVVVLRGRS